MVKAISQPLLGTLQHVLVFSYQISGCSQWLT